MCTNPVSNLFGTHIRIQPDILKDSLSNVQVRQGGQILRVPPGSTIKNITLDGGASHQSRWAVLSKS